MAIDLTALANDLWPLLQSKVADSARAAASTATIYTIDPTAAPKTAQFLTLAADATLTAERILTPGFGIAGVDAGAGSTFTLNIGAGTGMLVNADDVAVNQGFAFTWSAFHTFNAGMRVTGSTTWTTIGWNKAITLPNVSALVWEHGGTGYARGVGSTNNGDLYISRSTANDNSAPVVYDVLISAAGVASFLNQATVGSAVTTASPYLQIGHTGGSVSDLAIDVINGKTYLKNAGEQLRLLHDASNYATIVVSALGEPTITATGPRIMFPTTNFLQSPNYASQTTGWRIGGLGEADFRYIYTDELHAKKFIADLEQALAGLQIITKSVSMLGSAFTAPAPGGIAALVVKDLPSAPDMAVFEDGDIVLVRTFTRSGGGLTITNCWGVVTGYLSFADPLDKRQSWTFTRSTGADAGAMSTGTVVEVDSIVLDFGTSGNGYYEVNAIDGIYALNSPYAQIVTWTGHPATGKVVRGRYGNLRGIFGVTNEFGIFVGSGITTTDRYARISSFGALLQNIPLKLYTGGTQTVNIPEHGGSIGDPLWIGPNSGDRRLSWDGTNLKIVGSALIGPHTGFSTAALLHAPFDIAPKDNRPNVNGTFGQPATITGGIAGMQGKFGGAVMVGSGTTNRITNPSFETNTTGYFSDGSVTIGRTTLYSLFGQYSMSWSWTSGAANLYNNITGTLVASNTNYFSCYARRADGGVVSGVTCYIDSTLGPTGTTITDCGNGWYRISGFRNLGASIGNHVVGLEGLSTATTWYFDGWQVTISGFALSYVDGSLGPGHSWAGTANASMSTRDAAVLSYPTLGNIDPKQGSISLWALIDTFNSNGSYLWNAGNTAAEMDCHMSAAGIITFQINGNDVIHGTTITRGWHHIVCTWDIVNNQMIVYLDGVASSTGTPTAVYPSFHTVIDVGGIGSLVSTTYNLNGLIDDFAILPYVLTPDQVSAIYRSDSPLQTRQSQFELVLTDYNKGRVVANASGIFGTSLPLTGAPKPNFTLLNTAMTVNGEALGEGDVLMGDNTSGKSNLLWDNSTGDMLIRRGATNRIKAGADGNLSLNDNSGNTRILLDSSGTVALRDADGTTDRVVISSSGNLTLNDDSGSTRVLLDGSGNVQLLDDVGWVRVNITSGGLLSLRGASATDRVSLSGAGVLSINDSGGAAVFSFDASAGAEFTKSLTLGTSGGIWQGSSGTFASPTTGFKLYRSGSNGYLDLWNAGDISVRLAPDQGVIIRSGSAFATDKALNFFTAGGTRTGAIYSYTDGSTYQAIRMQANSASASQEAVSYMISQQEANGLASVYLIACKKSVSFDIEKPWARIYLESDQPNDQAQIKLEVGTVATTSTTYTLDKTGTTLTNGIKLFRIDHPLRRDTHWLKHAAVETDGNKTIYNGSVTLDRGGRAVVKLPEWFDALNTALSFSLTCIGGHASVYVAHVGDNQFEIAGGHKGLRVDWIIMAKRHDTWAAANPMEVESLKTDKERGLFNGR